MIVVTVILAKDIQSCMMYAEMWERRSIGCRTLMIENVLSLAKTAKLDMEIGMETMEPTINDYIQDAPATARSLVNRLKAFRGSRLVNRDGIEKLKS